MRWLLSHFDCSSIHDFNSWTPAVKTIEPWRETRVPGSAQTSPFGFPQEELLVAERWEQVAWMESRLWVWQTTVQTPPADSGRLWLLTLHGLDYRARIFVNGVLVTDHEGMFSKVEIELPADAQEHVIHLVFLPPVLIGAPFAPGTEDDEVLNLKARYMKGWDFCPRVACVGPWDDVTLTQRSHSRLSDIGVATRLDNTARADVAVTIHFNQPPGRGMIHVRIGEHDQIIPTDGERTRYTVALQIINPVLWWPHTHGKPHLYDLEVTHSDAHGSPVDRVSRQIGLRTVSRRPASGQVPTATPMQLEVNGVPVFINGMNLTPFSSTPSELTGEDYARILKPMRDAGVNFLRVWGGGLREKSAFYDWCDQHGMLVMQDFPLACQWIARDPDWLDLLQREGRAIARTLAANASVVWWTGGNEHYHFWEALDSGTPRMNEIKDRLCRRFRVDPADPTWRGGEPDNHPALRLLEGISREENPGSLYDITSALEDQGDVHGPWNLRLSISDHRFRDKEFFEHWRTARAHLFSECAVSTAAHPETVAQLLGLTDVAALASLPVPQRDDPLWVAHKAFSAAWDGHPDLWLDVPETERYFGPLTNLADLLFANHYLQCEAARYMVDTIRQRQGHTTGFIWWGGNEPYAGLAGCALVDFYGRVKPALKVLASAMAPRSLSLAYDQCVSRKFRGDLVFTNSLPDRFRGHYDVQVTWLDSTETVHTYHGQIDAAGYSVVRLAELMPVTLDGTRPLKVLLTLGAEDAAVTAQTKQYLFFAHTASAPLATLLSQSRQPVESFF